MNKRKYNYVPSSGSWDKWDPSLLIKNFKIDRKITHIFLNNFDSI